MQSIRRHNTVNQRAFPRRQLLGMAAGATGTLVLAACSGAASPTANTTANTSIATTAPAQTTVASAVSSGATVAPTALAAATAGSAAAGTAVKKVNANTASAAEIQQALEAAGVTNAARWVREVQEYRPYPTTDPSFAKLRGELAKYNPSQDTVDRIISALAL